MAVLRHHFPLDPRKRHTPRSRRRAHCHDRWYARRICQRTALLPGTTQIVDVQVTQRVLSANLHIYVVFAINVAIILLVLADLIRTQIWKGIPRVSYLDCTMWETLC